MTISTRFASSTANIIYFLSIFIFCLVTTFLTGQTDMTLLRFPSLNPDGSQLAFSYQGDIWTADANGGTARRLTIHESYESYPQWSPDGQNIVFQGNRYGNNDIFSIKATGSRPLRLTHHSTCLLYTSPSPRDLSTSRMPSSA